jgi:HPt (histidine-containing phosphotransfer) domain-containing protein
MRRLHLVAPDMAALDVAQALVSWRDAARYKSFLRKFLLDYADCVRQMRAADAVTARAQAHKLVGAAGSMVLADIAAAARSLHQTLTLGQAPEQDFIALQTAFDQAQGPILRYLAETSPAPAGEKTQASGAELARLLKEVLVALEEDTPLAVEPVLEKLAKLLAADHVAPLQRALQDFNFSLCKNEVRTLAGKINVQLDS